MRNKKRNPKVKGDIGHGRRPALRKVKNHVRRKQRSISAEPDADAKPSRRIINAIIDGPDPSPSPTPIPVRLLEWKEKIAAANPTKSATLDVTGVLNLLQGLAAIHGAQQDD